MTLTTDICHREDCFDRFNQLGDNSVDYVFTSPPYNRKRNDKYAHYDDCIEDYLLFLQNIASESLRVARKHVFINVMKNYYNAPEVYRFLGAMAEHMVELFVWEKSNPLPASGFSITNAYEFILVLGQTPLKSNHTYTKNHLTTSVGTSFEGHNAVMKTEVAEFFIRHFTREGEVVYDPFMGVGTTAVVCKSMGRRFVGSEISEEYHKLSLERLNHVQTKLF
jgi:site-specific DNA-methyltransferase (adenine-specific)/modification methylase